VFTIQHFVKKSLAEDNGVPFYFFSPPFSPLFSHQWDGLTKIAAFFSRSEVEKNYTALSPALLSPGGMENMIDTLFLFFFFLFLPLVLQLPDTEGKRRHQN